MKFKSNIELQAGVEAGGSTGSSGQVLSSTGSGVAWIDQSAVTLASDLVFFNVKNETGSTILKGKGVMAVGTDGNSGHILIDEMIADGSVEAKYFLGVLEEDIPNGGFARVISFGQLDQFNTSGQNGETWNDGQILWCDPANPGDFTITEPDGPNVKIAAAFILNSSTNGKIQIRVQANEGVHDLHDTKITSQVDGDVLVWDNTTGVWFNDSTLNVDYTNSRVGIGTISPGTKLDVDGVITATGGNSTQWNIAYTDRNKWDGGATGLVAATGRTSLGLGALAILGSVDAATITDNSVGAAELNVSGNGTTAQYLRSDGDGTFTWATPTNTTYGVATDATLGLIELFSNTDQTVAANAVTTTAGRTYGLQLNSANQGVINVPWTDTNTTYSAGTGLSLTGTAFSIDSSVVTLDGTQTLTNKTINGSQLVNTSVANGKLANSSLTVTAGTGMSGGGAVSLGGSITLTNNDKGSSQNIFKNVAVSGQTSIVADSNNDTLTFAAGSNITLTTDATTDTLTITANINPGDITGVTASAPLTGGGTSGNVTVGISQSSDTTDGYLSSADWTTFNSKTSNTGTVTSVGGTGTVSGLTLSGTVTGSGNLTLGGTLALTSANVTGALGYTPYNATNPSGYTTNTGTVTSVGISHAGNAFTAGTAVTTSGTLAITMAGTAAQYINGQGNLVTFPAIPQGDITAVVAGTGLSGGGTSGSVTLTNSAPNVTTNLSTTTAATTVTIVSSDGTNASIPAATTSVAGVMTGADKTKLNGIASGAQVNVATNLSKTTSTTDVTINSSTGTNIAIGAASTTVAGVMTKALYDNVIANNAKVSNVTTNLGYTASATNGVVTSSDGTNATLPLVVAAGNAGLMTGADKTKLNGIASGAEVNVQSDWNAASGDALILNKPTIYAEPGIFSGGGTPTLASGVTGAEVRSLIGAGTSSTTGTVQGVFAGGGLTGGVDFGTSTGTISHADTSSQASVNNSSGTVIQDITLDTYGHITGLASVNLDGRYYTETESDSRFVNVTGDTMSGDLTATNFILSSDERKKTKIEDLSCDNIDVNWKSFEMKNNEGEYRVGVIAQELEIKHPEFVNTDTEGFKSVKYIDLLIAKIAELEARLEKAGI